MSKRILFGGLMALGLLAASADTASAQFVTPFVQPGPFGSSYGAVYPTPSGGIVQKYAFTNPITGGTHLNSAYSNPFTGVVANRQAYIPNVSPFYYPSLYRPPVYYSNSYNYSVSGFNYFGTPYYNFSYGSRYGFRYFR